MPAALVVKMDSFINYNIDLQGLQICISKSQVLLRATFLHNPILLMYSTPLGTDADH